MTGTTIHHYRVGERIGGAMGDVYRAEDTRLKRDVVLKFVQQAQQFDPDRRARLIKEARAVSSLRSPNVVALFDIGEHDGAVFLVLEYVEGEVLSARLQRGPMPVVEAIDIAMQVADALDEAHSGGVVHRDIKSDNLIITPKGLAKILDFGLAKFIQPRDGDDARTRSLAEADSATTSGFIVGSISYMSPEQALGREIDHRSDLFSLGVVLYEMLAARRPFEGNSVTEVLDSVVHQEPPAVARFNYEVPGELEAILRKALQKDPNLRYQSAREFYIDLHHARAELKGGADSPQAAPRADQQAPRNAVAVVGFTNVTGDQADEWIGTGLAETIAADLQAVPSLAVIARERVLDAVKSTTGAGHVASLTDHHAIQAGRRLGAVWIVNGGFQKLGETVRVTARFVDVQTGELLKSVKIDAPVAEMLQLQDRVADALCSDLKEAIESNRRQPESSSP